MLYVFVDQEQSKSYITSLFALALVWHTKYFSEYFIEHHFSFVKDHPVVKKQVLTGLRMFEIFSLFLCTFCQIDASFISG